MLSSGSGENPEPRPQRGSVNAPGQKAPSASASKGGGAALPAGHPSSKFHQWSPSPVVRTPLYTHVSPWGPELLHKQGTSLIPNPETHVQVHTHPCAVSLYPHTETRVMVRVHTTICVCAPYVCIGTLRVRDTSDP